MENTPDHLVVDPIPRLLRQMAIPASIGFFFNTMYNVVDTYFASYISTEAIAGLSISFPLFFILIALGSGISSGATALIGNARGRGDYDGARQYSFQTLSFSAALAIILSIGAFFLLNPLLALLGGEDTYRPLAFTYLSVIFAGSIFFSLQFAANAILNAIGDTKTYRNVLIAGFFGNLILDPWFVLGGFGIPPLGIFGIALATILVNACGCIYMVYRAARSPIFEKFDSKNLIPDMRRWLSIATQGFPAGLSMMSVAIGVFIITSFISPFGSAAIAAFGIAIRIEQIFLLPAIGITVATLALTAQNNGAKRYDRIREIVQTALFAILGIMSVASLVIFFGRTPLLRFFTDDADVIAFALPYLGIAAFLTWTYATLFLVDSVLRGIQRPMFPLVIGLFRQIVGPLLIFPLFIGTLGLGIIGVWWGIFTVTWIATSISAFWLWRILKRFPKDATL